MTNKISSHYKRRNNKKIKGEKTAVPTAVFDILFNKAIKGRTVVQKI